MVNNSDLFKKVIQSSNCACDVTYQINKKESITYVNLYSYGILRKRPDLVQCFDRIYVDGILLVYLFRMLGFRQNRLSFDMTSMARSVLTFADENKLHITLVGEHWQVVSRCRMLIEKKYKNCGNISVYDGYFTQSPIVNVCKTIIQSQTDIVIVGMGTYAQEEFISTLNKLGYEGAAYTCGGFILQTANRGLQYYPNYINKLNLRWLYRLIKEPYKVGKRLLIYYPVNILRLLSDYFFYKANDKK